MRRLYCSGFSLVEMIVSVTIMGIISGLCLLTIGNTRERCMKAAAISKAHTLNSAKISYKISEEYAESKFNSISSDAGKYDVLKRYMLMAEESLDKFSEADYSFIIGDLNQRVRVGKGKTLIDY